MTRHPIRVLIFAPDPSLGGGVAAFDAILRRELGADFHAEQFLIGRRPGRAGKWFRLVMPFYDVARLVRRVLAARHDVYHLNPSLVRRSTLRDGLFLLVLELLRRPRTLVFIRGWDAAWYERLRRSRLLGFLFRNVYGRAARTLVLGSRFKDDLAALGVPRESIHVVTTMFDGALLDATSRARDDETVRILFLARFIPAKGIYELLEAFRRLLVDGADVRLVMAGDGPESALARAWCVEHGIERAVEFPGYLDGSDKAQVLLNADTFALPSYHGEGCPNALLEAMGAGLPVVTTPVGGIPDVVRDGVNGLIVDPRDVTALTDALRRLVEDADLRAQMSARNREQAWRCFEAKPVTAMMETHYRELVAPHDAVGRKISRRPVWK